MTYEPPGGPPPPPQQPWSPPPTGVPYPASAYGTPGYGYAPAVQTKPVKGLSVAVVVLVAIAGVVALIAAFALFHRASLLDGRIASLQEVKDADDAVSGSVGFLFFALVAAGVLWIIWQFRFAKNAEAMKGSYGLPAGWAIGGWFIPLGNYVLPQLQLFQAAKASDPDLPAGQPATSGRAPSTVIAWWVLYDLAWLLFGVGRAIRPSEKGFNSFNDVDKFMQADRISAVSALLFVGGAVVAILMVRSLTDGQTRMMASAAPSAGGYQQPYGQPAYGQPTYGQPPPPPYQAPPPPYQAPPPPWQQPPPPPPPPQPWQQPPPPAPPQQWPPPAPPPPQ